MRTQLLCTFTNEFEFENILESVNNSFELYSRKIFILKLSPSKELTLAELGKKFNLSPERIRQISEKKFSDLSKILIKNKKDLEIN